MKLVDLNWLDAEQYFHPGRAVIVPLGAVEQHGPAMPLGTDIMIAEALAEEVGKRCGRLVGPALSPGISLYPHMNFTGTISFRPDTFTRMVREYLESLFHHGARIFLLINGHGGNDGAIKNALIDFGYDFDDVKYASANWWRMPEVVEFIKQKTGRGPGHACASEASLVMHIREDLVREDRFGAEFKEYPFHVSNNLAGQYATESGLMVADQTSASPTFGAELFEMAVSHYIRLTESMESS